MSATYQNATVQEVLTDLQGQYGLKFAYLNNELPIEQSITLSLQNVSLSDVLDSVLSDTALSYQLVNGQIVLRNNSEKAQQSVPEPKAEETVTPDASPHADKSDTQVPTAGSSVPTEDSELTEEGGDSAMDDSPIEELPSGDSRDDKLQNDDHRWKYRSQKYKAQ